MDCPVVHSFYGSKVTLPLYDELEKTGNVLSTYKHPDVVSTVQRCNNAHDFKQTVPFIPTKLSWPTEGMRTDQHLFESGKLYD